MLSTDTMIMRRAGISQCLHAAAPQVLQYMHHLFVQIFYTYMHSMFVLFNFHKLSVVITVLLLLLLLLSFIFNSEFTAVY